MPPQKPGKGALPRLFELLASLVCGCVTSPPSSQGLRCPYIFPVSTPVRVSKFPLFVLDQGPSYHLILT